MINYWHFCSNCRNLEPGSDFCFVQYFFCLWHWRTSATWVWLCWFFFSLFIYKLWTHLSPFTSFCVFFSSTKNSHTPTAWPTKTMKRTSWAKYVSWHCLRHCVHVQWLCVCVWVWVLVLSEGQDSRGDTRWVLEPRCPKCVKIRAINRLLWCLYSTPQHEMCSTQR